MRKENKFALKERTREIKKIFHVSKIFLGAQNIKNSRKRNYKELKDCCKQSLPCATPSLLVHMENIRQKFRNYFDFLSEFTQRK